jgi:hypothetical protein
MRQSFLDSLIGLDTKTAEKACADHNLKAWVMPPGSVSILLAFNGVKIYTSQDRNTVESVEVGDPLAVED